MLRLKALTKHLHLPLQQQMLRFMNLRGMVKTELLIPKRMFSDRSESGIGGALLTFLEKSAKEMGYIEVRLETRHINYRAVNFYMKNGYVPIENYGLYIGRTEAICFSKALR